MDKNKLIPLLQQIKALAEECLTDLEGSALSQRPTKKRIIRAEQTKAQSLDFDKPIRAFVKQYAKGMSGPAKFVLLLSYMVNGDPNQEVASKDIAKQWSRMTARSLLAIAFDNSYPMRAKENDWIDSKKRGFFSLRPRWQNIFTEPNG